MKNVWLASIVLAALSILAPSANAQQKTTMVPLVQKFQPVTRSYPGVAADILGIRTGMTVSQAEAIAVKNYPGRHDEQKNTVSFDYKEITVKSDSFVQTVNFANQAAGPSDKLSLQFTSPATGNRLYEISRDITFYNNDQDPKGALNAPLVSTLVASLTKKYGHASFKNGSPYPGLVIGWVFTQNGQILCRNNQCSRDRFSLGQYDLSNMLEDLYQWKSLPPSDCFDTYLRESPFIIAAVIRTSFSDNTKAMFMSVSIGDESTCINDSDEVTKQLKAAAIKFYNKVSKATAAPKM